MKWSKFDFLDGTIWCTEFVGAHRYEIIWRVSTDKYPRSELSSRAGLVAEFSRDLPKHWIFI